MKRFVDARAAVPDFSPAELRLVVDVLRRLAKESTVGSTAIIVDSDLGYGMLRMLEMLVEDVCAIRPFRRREDAEVWLDPA